MGAGAPPRLTSVSSPVPCVTHTHFSLQVQHVYPAQVQYVEGGDAVYANGAMYVCSVRALVPHPHNCIARCGTGMKVAELPIVILSHPHPQSSQVRSEP